MDTDFQSYLRQQISRHPSAQPQDVVKQCYQAAFGAEHLLGDPAAARAFFAEEYAAAPESGAALSERISPEVCRVNLADWRKTGMPAEWLFRMFTLSAPPDNAGQERFLQYLSDAEELIRGGGAGFSRAQWRAYLEKYREGGMGAVHHSDAYRRCERPAYRLVGARVLRLLPILFAVLERGEQARPFVISIDGRAASGKSTAAEQLGVILGGSVVHMDDFFLPMALRTPERLAEPGGNVHYERFSQEVLAHLGAGEEFAYRVFSCGKMDYDGVRQIPALPFCIVEGSYAAHPAFGEYADLKVFSTIEQDEQRARILARDGAEAAERFRQRWIPMEERYFAAFSTAERANIILA